MVVRKDISTEEIVELYQRGLIGREIAEKLECSISLVQQRLAKAGIKMRDCNSRRTIDVDPNVLKEMYWDKKMHPREIGAILGMHKNTVAKKMREFDIPLRTKSEARIKELNPIYGIGHSKATKEKMSALFVTGERNLDAIKNNQYGKRVKYAGEVFRSSWEYGFALFLDNHNVPWEYEPHRIGYKFKGQRRTYIPDFYLPKGLNSGYPTYVEIKGYSAKKDRYKLVAIKRKLPNLVIYRRQDLLKLGIIDQSGKVIVSPKEEMCA